MKAVVLAGGFATRLRPLSCTRPKILFPIVNKPLLQWTLERLAKNHVQHVVLAVNYQTEAAVKQYRIPRHGTHLVYSRDPLRRPLGTGGPVKRAEKRLGRDDAFLVLNGDVFSDVDYASILRMHEQRNAMATIALHEVKDPSRYGVAQIAEDNRIEKFVEKPTRESAPSNFINAGVYAFSPKILKRIPRDRQVSLERDIFPKLAEEGTLYGYVHKGVWSDIGKPEDYLEINWTMLDLFGSHPHVPAVSDGIRQPVALGSKVSIGKNSRIGPYAVLDRNVAVGDCVQIENSVVLRETEISDSAIINGAIIGEAVSIGKGAKIGRGCVIGDHVRILDNTKLAGKVLVCPAKHVSGKVLKSKYIV